MTYEPSEDPYMEAIEDLAVTLAERVGEQLVTKYPLSMFDVNNIVSMIAEQFETLTPSETTTSSLARFRLTPLPEERERILRRHADAQVWAQEFMRLIDSGCELDEGLMIGWFANAMETAKREDHNLDQSFTVNLAAQHPMHDPDVEAQRLLFEEAVRGALMSDRGRLSVDQLVDEIVSIAATHWR